MAPFDTTLRPKVYQIVSTLDDLQIVLDDKHRVTTVNQGVEGPKQDMDIMKMKSRRRFVKDKERGALLFHCQIVGQLDTLVFSAR